LKINRKNTFLRNVVFTDDDAITSKFKKYALLVSRKSRFISLIINGA